MKYARAEHDVHSGETQLDREWIRLMQEARQLGLTRDEVRIFLKKEENRCTQS